MFDTFQEKNSIKKIATTLPRKLVKRLDKKEYYCPEEVESIFIEVLGSDTNIHYAYAMFCSSKDFTQLAQLKELDFSYSDLRKDVADKCFDGWPRFNFESLLNLSTESPMPDLVNEVTDIGLDILKGI